MNEQEVHQAVSKALNKVKNDETDLLKFDVNERSLTHRLAVYLNEEFSREWDVDVEYNREGEEEVSKSVPIEFLKDKVGEDVSSEDTDGKQSIRMSSHIKEVSHTRICS